MNRKKSITRFDYNYTRPSGNIKSTHGYYVRVYYKGKIHSPRFFSDKRFGSKRKALKAAVLYRDMLENRLGKPQIGQPVVAITSLENKGIRRILKTQKKRGKRYTWEVYEITAPHIKGTSVRRTSISIQKYGEKEALELALLHKAQFEKQVYGISL